MGGIEPWIQTTQLLQEVSFVLKFVLLKSLIPTKEKVRECWTKKQREEKREKEKETVAFQGHVLISFC